MRKHIINAVTGIIIGGFFLYLTLRNKPLDQIFELLSAAKTSWILLSIVFLVIMFFFRAYRWKLLIKNDGHHPDIKNVSYSLLLGFFVNSFTPKLGEIIRCTSLQKSTGIPVSRSFGTVISERIYDLIALIIAISIILLLEFDRLRKLIITAGNSIRNSLTSNLLNLALLIGGLVLLILALVMISSHYKLIDKIRSFLKELWHTVKNTFRIKSSRMFAFQTIMIWLFMILVNYCCLRALPSTESLSLYFAFVVLFVGTIGWAIPSPGGIGTSHFFVLQLFLLFSLSEETGITYGLLVNGITVLFTIGGGMLAIIIVNSFKLVKKATKG
ncbi:MAG: lysylphosphatidylglycerol synthase transmembrane domain-containing protein [Bacteroidales bacterium]|nr:lysylphosphatidylglycerol synthase transmembrane domain-containing protein [Bacteroidales bacterium]